MIDKKKLAEIADIIKDYFLPVDSGEYEAETGISRNDFRQINLTSDLDGDIYAIDGSNVVVFDLGNVNVNYIRAGYVVYRGTKWHKTVITYNDLFAADRKNYVHYFNRYRKGIFGLDESFRLKSEEELDRISTFFRDLQEYVAISEALGDAKEGDIVLYDGGFALWRDPYYREVFNWLFKKAEDKNVDLLGISKSSKLSWGREISKPLVKSTNYIGSQSSPDKPWYVKLSDKRVIGDDSWHGRTYIAKFHPKSTHAFRVDAPTYVVNHINTTLSHVCAYSQSAESLGYPHALFRAHHDIRIPTHERNFIRLSLFDKLGDLGLNEQQIRSALDYHEILDMLRR